MKKMTPDTVVLYAHVFDTRHSPPRKVQTYVGREDVMEPEDLVTQRAKDWEDAGLYYSARGAVFTAPLRQLFQGKELQKVIQELNATYLWVKSF